MMLKEFVSSKCVMNKVEFEGEFYLRVYNIDNVEGREGYLINTRLFKEVKSGVYLPIFLDRKNDERLINRLRHSDINEDIIMANEDINLFLINLKLYVENTYNLVKDYVEKHMSGYDVVLYKEYMNIFYIMLSSEKDAKLCEVRIDVDGQIELLPLDDDLIDIIVCRDLHKHISIKSDIYIKTSKGNYIVISNMFGRKCFIFVVKHEDGAYSVKSIRLAEDFRKEINVDFNKTSDKIKHIIALEKKDN